MKRVIDLIVFIVCLPYTFYKIAIEAEYDRLYAEGGEDSPAFKRFCKRHYRALGIPKSAVSL